MRPAAIKLCALFIGCVSSTACAASLPPSNSASPTSSKHAETSVQVAERVPAPNWKDLATDVIVRWDDAAQVSGVNVIYLTSPRRRQIGNWEPENFANKLAVKCGRVTAEPLAGNSDVDHASAVVRRGVNREEIPVRLIAADEAVVQLQESGDGVCTNSATISVHDAQLSSIEVDTAAGPATVPAWSFAVRGSSARLEVVAITQEQAPPSLLALDNGTVPDVESAQPSNGTGLLVRFTGSPGTAESACGADYTAEAVESATSVVVGITTFANTSSKYCAAVGAGRTATVILKEPLGDRIVLSLRFGLPLPLKP